MTLGIADECYDVVSLIHYVIQQGVTSTLLNYAYLISQIPFYHGKFNNSTHLTNQQNHSLSFSYTYHNAVNIPTQWCICRKYIPLQVIIHKDINCLSNYSIVILFGSIGMISLVDLIIFSSYPQNRSVNPYRHRPKIVQSFFVTFFLNTKMLSIMSYISITNTFDLYFSLSRSFPLPTNKFTFQLMYTIFNLI